MATYIASQYSKKFLAGLMLPLFLAAGIMFAGPKPAEASYGSHHQQPLINVGAITCAVYGLFCPAKVVHVDKHHHHYPKNNKPKHHNPTPHPTPYPTQAPQPTPHPCSSGCSNQQAYGWPRAEYQNPFGVSYGSTSWWSN